MWRIICTRFGNRPPQYQALNGNMIASTMSWTVASYIIITPSLFVIKLVLSVFSAQVLPTRSLVTPCANALLRFYSILYGTWGYRRAICIGERPDVQFILAYCASSGMGVHIAAMFANLGASRAFLQPPHMTIKVALRFVHAALRFLFDLLQHVYTGLAFAERDVLGKGWWVVGKGLFLLLVSCFVYQGVVILPVVALDRVAEIVDLGDGVVDEGVEAFVLGAFVMGFWRIWWIRYKKLATLEERQHTNRCVSSGT